MAKSKQTLEEFLDQGLKEGYVDNMAYMNEFKNWNQVQDARLRGYEIPLIRNYKMSITLRGPRAMATVEFTQENQAYQLDVLKKVLKIITA